MSDPKNLPSELRSQLQQLLLDRPLTFWQKTRRFLTPITAAFGLVTMSYGFEALLGHSVLQQHPGWMIGVGAVLLLITGSFFTKS